VIIGEPSGLNHDNCPLCAILNARSWRAALKTGNVDHNRSYMCDHGHDGHPTLGRFPI
jgi:hypothetical protein